MSEYVKIAAAVMVPFIGGFASSRTMKDATKTWYKTLDRPPWTPPNWVFPPMWASLYTAMGYASYLTWRDGGGFDGAMVPLSTYAASLALNWAWTPVFFGMRRFGAGAAIIVSYLGVVCATTYLYYPINATASYLMMPLIAWVSLASSVNIWVWLKNKDKSA